MLSPRDDPLLYACFPGVYRKTGGWSLNSLGRAGCLLVGANTLLYWLLQYLEICFVPIVGVGLVHLSCKAPIVLAALRSSGTREEFCYYSAFEGAHS